MNLELREITPDFGATVHGWSPSADLDGDLVEQLRAGFDQYQVLVFRDLDVPAGAQQYLCGLLVGDRAPTDRASAQSNTHLYGTRISNKDEDGNAPYGRLLFHADGMWSESPQEVLSLYGEIVERPCVPTVFASGVNAWERLPEELRARIEGHSAVHATGQRNRGADADLLQPRRRTERSRSTALPTIHPRTARPILYVSQMMTTHLEGLAPEESELLLESLFEVLYAPANTFEHDWNAGDLVVWDNLAVQHARGTVTQEGPERSLRKVAAPALSADFRASMERPTFAEAPTSG